MSLEGGFNILMDDKVFNSSCGRKIGLPIGEHHSGGTNWLFLDAHVKWMTNQQVADLDCGNPPLPPNFTPK
jgi:prepilin-type processing-associated H-X9-DG protein